MTAHDLIWPHGRATVLTSAAMLADCRFDLPAGPFYPFARAPWMDGPVDPAVSGHLRVLGGDFVCVPFGRGRAIPGAPPDWASVLTVDETGPVHGPAAEDDWHITQADAHSITLSLDYPKASPVRRLVRSIAARPDAPALDLTLTIFARRTARVSVGLHPILRLPSAPGRLHLAADFQFGQTHPGQTLPGQTQDFASLSAVPRSGGPIDMAHLPLSPQTDLNVQLCGMQGPVTAIWLDEGAGLVIDWDRGLLPSLQLWHTDRGIGGPPWHHTYRGLGVEPVCAAFDQGTHAATAANPIATRGVPTAMAIGPDQHVMIRYSMGAFAT